jgi:hypothetical protein
MAPQNDPRGASGNDDAIVIFCATCEHSEFVHADHNLRCVFSICDCNEFIAGKTPEISSQVFPA